ncbi:hypothetical protein ANCCAN_25166, partial [Ancylostoma caninum]
LERIYPNIGWRSYLKKLLGLKSLDEEALGNVIVTQPSFFAWLNSMLATQQFEKRILVNHMIVQLLFDNIDFLSVPLNYDHQQIISAGLHPRRDHRKLRSLKRHVNRLLDLKESSIHCMEIVVNYLPFGAGYVYVKSMEDRDKRYEEIKNYARLMIKTFQDIIRLPNWMSSETKKFAIKKGTHVDIPLLIANRQYYRYYKNRETLIQLMRFEEILDGHISFLGISRMHPALTATTE